MRRFFVPHFSSVPGATTLPRDTSHHLKTVLRLREGMEIVVCDGAGGCCLCRIDHLDAKATRVQVLKSWQEVETALSIQLLQGLPHSDKFDLILQKNTELGVARFVPLRCERCQFSLPPAKEARKVERWRKIVTEAARQSGRSWLPQIESPQSLAQAVAECESELKLVLWEEAHTPLVEVLPSVPPASVAIVVGPEGGLSRQEIASAQAAGFVTVGLGPRILRTETAALALAAILQYQYGDLNLAPSAPPNV